MLFASWEVHIVKNCDWGLENAARGCIFKSKVTVFHYRADPKPVNNFYLFIFFQALKRKKTHEKKLTQALLWLWSEIGKSGLH